VHNFCKKQTFSKAILDVVVAKLSLNTKKPKFGKTGELRRDFVMEFLKRHMDDYLEVC
jgi:hypothetical protein